jgi:integrase
VGHDEARELKTVEFQEWFNSFHPRLSPKTIRLMHASLRAPLSQAIAWGMIERNPAVGVKLPRKHAVKPTVLLSLYQIRQMLETLPEPTRSLVALIVFASMRPGEVLALWWKNILPDRIFVEERVYDDEFDDVKTDAGKREVPSFLESPHAAVRFNPLRIRDASSDANKYSQRLLRSLRSAASSRPLTLRRMLGCIRNLPSKRNSGARPSVGPRRA